MNLKRYDTVIFTKGKRLPAEVGNFTIGFSNLISELAKSDLPKLTYKMILHFIAELGTRKVGPNTIVAKSGRGYSEVFGVAYTNVYSSLKLLEENNFIRRKKIDGISCIVINPRLASACKVKDYFEMHNQICEDFNLRKIEKKIEKGYKEKSPKQDWNSSMKEELELKNKD